MLPRSVQQLLWFGRMVRARPTVTITKLTLRIEYVFILMSACHASTLQASSRAYRSRALHPLKPQRVTMKASQIMSPKSCLEIRTTSSPDIVSSAFPPQQMSPDISPILGIQTRSSSRSSFELYDVLPHSGQTPVMIFCRVHAQFPFSWEGALARPLGNVSVPRDVANSLPSIIAPESPQLRDR